VSRHATTRASALTVSWRGCLSKHRGRTAWLTLPYPIVTDKHGNDVTDFMLDHDPREFQQLLDDAKPYSVRRKKAA
jgi:hypothetical protein